MQASSSGATPPVDTRIITIDPENFTDEQLSYPVELIKRGDVVAFPTETVYGLGANALRSCLLNKRYEVDEHLLKIWFYFLQCFCSIENIFCQKSADGQSSYW